MTDLEYNLDWGDSVISNVITILDMKDIEINVLQSIWPVEISWREGRKKCKEDCYDWRLRTDTTVGHSPRARSVNEWHWECEDVNMKLRLVVLLVVTSIALAQSHTSPGKSSPLY